jgi:hypothetical protein
MNLFSKEKQHGSLSIISIASLAVIIFVLASAVFNIDFQKVAEDPETTKVFKEAVQSEQTKKNVDYVGNQTKSFWDRNLKTPVNNFYNNIFLVYIWHPFKDNMQKIQRGEPTILQEAAPVLDFNNMR